MIWNIEAREKVVDACGRLEQRRNGRGDREPIRVTIPSREQRGDDPYADYVENWGPVLGGEVTVVEKDGSSRVLPRPRIQRSAPEAPTYGLLQTLRDAFDALLGMIYFLGYCILVGIAVSIVAGLMMAFGMIAR